MERILAPEGCSTLQTVGRLILMISCVFHRCDRLSPLITYRAVVCLILKIFVCFSSLRQISPPIAYRASCRHQNGLSCGVEGRKWAWIIPRVGVRMRLKIERRLQDWEKNWGWCLFSQTTCNWYYYQFYVYFRFIHPANWVWPPY